MKTDKGNTLNTITKTMKKLFTIICTLLACPALYSQVSLDLNIIGRVDANPRITPAAEKKASFNWANTSLYTHFELGFADKLTLSIINHWAASDEEHLYPFASTPALYTDSWKSDCDTWLDCLTLEWTISDNWSLRLGKDYIAIGGFEYDDWDWDCDYDLCSPFWHENSAYQWGASVAWTSDSGHSTFRLQAVSSPYSYKKIGESEIKDFLANPKEFEFVARPWMRGCGSYYFQYTANHQFFDLCSSIGFVQQNDMFGSDKIYGLINAALGARFKLIDESLSIGVDFLNYHNPFDLGALESMQVPALGELLPYMYGVKNMFHNLYTVKYVDPAEKWEVLGKFGLQNYAGENCFFGGVSAAYFPLRECTDLRLMATIACNPWINEGLAPLSITIGLTYNLPIHIL